MAEYLGHNKPNEIIFKSCAVCKGAIEVSRHYFLRSMGRPVICHKCSMNTHTADLVMALSGY